jgi:hypothetical protein
MAEKYDRTACVIASGGGRHSMVGATVTVLYLLGWFAIGSLVSTVAAQRLERPHELRLPGTNVTLRADWQLLFHDGCHFAVPASWPPTADHTLTRSLDGALTLVVATVPLVNWSAHKAQVRAAIHSGAVQEDTDSRFRFQAESGHRLLEYVAVRNGATACTGQIEIDAVSAGRFRDTMNRILESVGPSADLWRALVK